MQSDSLCPASLRPDPYSPRLTSRSTIDKKGRVPALDSASGAHPAHLTVADPQRAGDRLRIPGKENTQFSGGVGSAFF